MDEPGDDPPPGRGAPIGRAAFLGVVAAGIAGVFVGPRLASAISGRVGGALPSSLGALFPQTTGWRIYAVAPPFPRFDPATYVLRIGGAVERPVTLVWSEVAALPGEEQVSDFHCVTGWSVYGVRWEGVRPATIVELVRPRPEARHVTFLSLEEPYADQLTLEQFLLPDVMLARGMDGRPMPREHGAPLRLVIPRMYGYKGVKWLGGIRFDTAPGLGYWEQRGYDVDAWVGSSNGYG